MSKEKKRTKNNSKQQSPTSNLFSFFSESTESIIKIKPEFVLLITISLITAVILSSIFLKL